MLAIDTNLIIRYITNDHPKQSALARALIEQEDLFVCSAVLLETEWVLRGTYRHTSEQISAALRAFAGLPRISFENPLAVRLALDWMEGGVDFADALHLASTRNCTAFVSCDARLAKVAKKIGTLEVRAP